MRNLYKTNALITQIINRYIAYYVVHIHMFLIKEKYTNSFCLSIIERQHSSKDKKKLISRNIQSNTI
jgi:hypothetical protein